MRSLLNRRWYVARFPMPEAAGDNEGVLDLLRAVARSSAAERCPAAAADVVGEAPSTIAVIRERDEDLEESEVDSKRPRKSPPAAEGSAIQANPRPPGGLRG